MTTSDLIYRRALAMLWSAGHEPTRDDRFAMRSKAWNVSLAPDWLTRRAALNEAAATLLREFGHQADATVEFDVALPYVGAARPNDVPTPGDAVRITGEDGWNGVPRGGILVLTGCHIESRMNVGRGHHHLHESGLVNLSSGGPASIIGLRTEVLVRTDETVRMGFWRFHLSPEANGGVDFTRPVNLWEWDGAESAFDDVIGRAA